MDKSPKKRSIGRRIFRIVVKTFLFIIAFLLLVIILIQTPPVQNFLRKKAVTWLEKKLHTNVEIGRIYVGLPKKIIIENVYIEDQQKDTLLSSGSMKINLNLLRLIFNGETDFKDIELNDITAKVKRQLPDTTYNFQFIIDAFASKDDDEPKDTATSSSSSVNIRAVELNRVRLVYKDVITGNDMETWLNHFDIKIDKFDLEHMIFNVPETNIDGLVARAYQTKPLMKDEPAAKDVVEAKQPATLQLNIGKVNLKNIKADYRNDVSATYANLDLGAANIQSKKIDLDNRIIDLKNFSLSNTTAAIRLGKTQQAKVVEQQTEQEVKSQAEAGWQISLTSLDLDNNNIQFDNDNSPRIKNAIDYAHIKADSFTLKADDIVIKQDSYAGKITKGEFKEQSGFVLDELQTEFLYSANEAYLKNLSIKTPGTELKRSAAIHYASIESLKNDIGNMEIDLDLQESKLLVKDILTFVPALRQQPAFADPNTTWYINSKITGRVVDLKVDELQIQGLQDTKIDISGRLAGLPDMNRINADINIRNISSSRRDINLFVPKNTLPQNITLPNALTIRGNIKGNTASINTNIALTTDLGNANVKGSFQNINNAKTAKYDAVVETKSLDLGTILQDKKTYGPVSATFTAKGTGYDVKTTNAIINGEIHSAVYKEYRYNNLKINGAIVNQRATLEAGIVDPNIHFALNAAADLSGKYPAVQMDAMIDSIKMHNLHLTPEIMIYRGKIEADFPVPNMDSLQGKLFITQSLFVQKERRLKLDTVQLVAGSNDSGRYVRLKSDVANAELYGQYKITELGIIFQQAIQPYFAIAPGDSIITREPYDFYLNAYILDNPALRVFVPSLDRMDSVSLRSHFSDSAGFTASLKAPVIDMGSNKIRNFDVEASTKEKAIDIRATVKQFSSGTNIQLDNTTLAATLSNNNVDFNLNIKDKASKDKYNVSGLIQQPANGDYQLSLKPDSLLLNYKAWTISNNNKIIIAKKGINAENFVLSKDGQQMSINSVSGNGDAPMEVKFDNFRLSTLTGFIQTDSTFANGTLNGKITFTDLATEPVFIGDLTINDLSLKQDTIGNVHVLIDNKTQNTYAADITLSGRGNDVKITGNYFVKPNGNSNFDLDLDIREMPVATAQAFSGGAIKQATGSVNGKFDVTGTFAQPVVNGDLNFNKAGFNFKMLNSYFTIDQEKIKIDGTGIHFDRFEVKDSAQNSLTIDGVAATSNFSNYKFDLDVRANNFRALNSTKKDNKLFYGQLYFNTDLKINGTEAAPIVDGRLVINEKTKMTVVLPQKEPGIAEREGVVEFIDMDAPLNDSLFLAVYDSFNTAGFRGLDISVNIEVKREAEFSLVIDEGNGDFLKVKGEALLNAGIDPSGKISLAGSYELDEGSYELSFNFLRRKFDIQKGSRIVWEGEPTAANVDVTAKYIANTAPLDLVKNQLDNATGSERNTYLQKLPFEVILKMEGKLLKPQISFDIVLPDNKSYIVSNDIITNVRTRLDQLRQEEGEMNKQVFSLLLLNRFVAENPFESSGGGPTPETFARQSASKLLTEQLNRLATDLVSGVDLNFDVLSSEDYTTGERKDRTDLNVGISKRLLNDRLTVSVGSNFELEGPQSSNQGSNIAGNVAVDYRLSKDNRYLLRAYRKNEYQGVIDGYVIETGVGFIITIDYNRFSQIFKKKKTPEQRRKEQEAKKEQEKKESLPTVKQTENK